MVKTNKIKVKKNKVKNHNKYKGNLKWNNLKIINKINNKSKNNNKKFNKENKVNSLKIQEYYGLLNRSLNKFQNLMLKFNGIILIIKL